MGLLPPLFEGAVGVLVLGAQAVLWVQVVRAVLRVQVVWAVLQVQAVQVAL